MDSILGAYKDKHRYFGTAYLYFRLLHLFTLAALVPLMYVGAATFYLIIAVIAVALLAPYKNHWHTAVDIVLISATLTGTLTMVVFREGMMVAPAEAAALRHTIYNPLGYLAMSIIPLYGFMFYSWRVLPGKCLIAQARRLRLWLMEESDQEEPLIHRMKQENVD